jgi:hypothetical protein
VYLTEWLVPEFASKSSCFTIEINGAKPVPVPTKITFLRPAARLSRVKSPAIFS